MLMTSLIMVTITNFTLFSIMKTPLSMGMVMMLQTLTTCIILSVNAQTYWYSYMLLLIFMGGMLILFIYVASLASNYMFKLSNTSLFMLMTVTAMSAITILFADKFLTNFSINNKESLLFLFENPKNEIPTNMSKMYSMPTNMVTIMLMNYLFLTLILSVKLTALFMGPIRQSLKFKN